MPLHLYDVLRAVPTACGRRNGIDWPCGVLVVPRGEGRLLRDAFVVTTGAEGVRPGVTTRREEVRLTGSRRARTRIVWEKRSTDRLRTTSSWCLRACGTR